MESADELGGQHGETRGQLIRHGSEYLPSNMTPKEPSPIFFPTR
jgi:hypothetical protein